MKPCPVRGDRMKRRDLIAYLQARWRRKARAQQPTGIRRIGVLGRWRGGSRAEIQRPLTQKELMKNLYSRPPRLYGRMDRRCGRLLWKGLRRDYPRLAGAALSNSRTGAQAQSMGRIVAVPLETGLSDREKTEYEATGKFLWRKQLQPIAIGMKRQVGNGMVCRSSRARCARHCNSDGCDAAPNGK